MERYLGHLGGVLDLSRALPRYTWILVLQQLVMLSAFAMWCASFLILIIYVIIIPRKYVIVILVFIRFFFLLMCNVGIGVD